ncbi:hypothetical protein [Gloeocapsa sp. PCC 73106]|uniref:hypothetical protein n=1 Tax=Gloeocapsa sp. PCC 73106 TaxID=102232 RepID=UPI0002AC313D|nr:hypothetical protein [Gloeocapsa sp. PCC 73106]ELR99206.1 hypothetical protein GLO73106DRAFT_00030550 [Gloeocapsa sp. PCC 73106]
MSQPKVIISEPCIYVPKDYWHCDLTIVKRRKIGEILQEADLISPAQIETALMDQKYHQELHLGEILALRGWIKQETADFFAQQWYDKIASPQKRPLGYYLMEAGLLNEQQIEAILKEQQTNWLKFGAIAVLKGWLKKTTVDFFVGNLFPDRKTDSIYAKQPQAKVEINTHSSTGDTELLYFVNSIDPSQIVD